MKVRNLVVTGLLILTGSVFGQTSALPKSQFKISYLDSIKATFKNDDIASCIDSLWMKELSNPELFADLSNDIKNIDLDEKVDYELSTDLLKKRLKAMDEKSPFNIEYNPALENIIKSFLKNRKKSFERLMAISEYYFPMFEEAMAKLNVPLEIKYLAVVESALNPKAVSRVGATGLWQFMYHTGKQYNLNIDSYVDERSDPLKASLAAAQYMSNMHKIFGDWELVLASYNSGPGNVSKAIRRSNGGQTFWDIRKHLPKETQGYVPAFLATMYIYEYHKEHGIIPNRAKIKHFGTDTIRIKQQLTFKQISNLLDIPVAQLQLLNPSYKMDVVPFYKDVDHFLRLPADKIAVFSSNEDKIYAYAVYDNNSKNRMQILQTRLAQSRDSINEHVKRDRLAKAERLGLTKEKEQKPETDTLVAFHKVKRGDNLSEIADKYGVTVSEIKKWNHLRSSSAPLGRKLKIVGVDESKLASNEKKETKVPAVKENKSESTEFYIVQKGDNLGSIAKKFDISIADLKGWNNLENNSVNAEAKLRIVKPENQVTFSKEKVTKESSNETYTVQKGEYLGTIAKKFGVTVAEIREWNNLDSDNVNAGKKLTIQKDEPKGKAKTEIALNNKKDKAYKDMHEYVVKKGDSLFTIAKKAGVTVSDIKKWNGISGDDLKPGMKLKING